MSKCWHYSIHNVYNEVYVIYITTLGFYWSTSDYDNHNVNTTIYSYLQVVHFLKPLGFDIINSSLNMYNVCSTGEIRCHKIILIIMSPYNDLLSAALTCHILHVTFHMSHVSSHLTVSIILDIPLRLCISGERGFDASFEVRTAFLYRTSPVLILSKFRFEIRRTVCLNFVLKVE